MKICAIICEFNPLHNAHADFLNKAREISHADKIICVMSGNYVQRGESAILNKSLRSGHAISAGADMVLELPVFSATGSCDDFAMGAMRIISKIKADCVVFGSECGDINKLFSAANALNSPDINKCISENIRQGKSYARSVSEALLSSSIDILLSPNNTLGVSYINAANKLSYNGEFLTIKRDSDYNASTLEAIPSATAIRNNIYNDNDVSQYVPLYVNHDLKKAILISIYESFAHMFLQTVNMEYLASVYGATEGIHNRIEKFRSINNYNDFLMAVKTKRYTLLKIKRIILNSILGITNDIIKEYRNYPPYSKVLAINEKDRRVLMPLIADVNIKPSQNLIEIERKADRLYNLFESYSQNK